MKPIVLMTKFTKYDAYVYVAGPQVLICMYAADLFAAVSTFTRGTRAFPSNFPKMPLAKIGKKMIDLTSKLGEINDG